MIILKIIAVLFIVAGFITVFAAKLAVKKYGLDEKSKCDFEHEMGEEELKQYKYNKAVVNLKMIGLLVALPGFVIMFIVFR
jgi:hypothetical protein